MLCWGCTTLQSTTVRAVGVVYSSSSPPLWPLATVHRSTSCDSLLPRKRKGTRVEVALVLPPLAAASERRELSSSRYGYGAASGGSACCFRRPRLNPSLAASGMGCFASVFSRIRMTSHATLPFRARRARSRGLLRSLPPRFRRSHGK